MSKNIADILSTLENGVHTLMNSNNFKDYLRFMASFPSYSYRNSLLLYLQCKERGTVPSLFAPYRKIQQMHRHIKKGAKSYYVIAPHQYKKKKSDGTDEEKLGFHIAHTFEVLSQSEPDDASGEIPELCQRLTGDLSDTSLLDTIVSVSPVPVSFEPIPGDANGFFDKTQLSICVDNSNAKTQQVKTLLHEIAHAWHYSLDPDFETSSTATKETIAEATAYTVCQHLNISSEDYSFGYLALYNKNDKDLSVFKQNLKLIQKISNQIINDIEDTLDASIIT